MQLLPRRLRSLHIAGDAIAVTKLFQTGVERAAAFEAAIVRRCGGADDAALESAGRGVAVANELGVFFTLFLGQPFAPDALCFSGRRSLPGATCSSIIGAGSGIALARRRWRRSVTCRRIGAGYTALRPALVGEFLIISATGAHR